MVDANYNLEDCRKEHALWKAKKELLEWIVAEKDYTSDWRGDMSEEDKELYLSALDLLSEAIAEYGILPWEEKKGE